VAGAADAHPGGEAAGGGLEQMGGVLDGGLGDGGAQQHVGRLLAHPPVPPGQA